MIQKKIWIGINLVSHKTKQEITEEYVQKFQNNKKFKPIFIKKL